MKQQLVHEMVGESGMDTSPWGSLSSQPQRYAAAVRRSNTPGLKWLASSNASQLDTPSRPSLPTPEAVCRAKRSLKLPSFVCLWQRREQLDPSGAVADGFQMGRALAGVLGRPLPVDHRLLGAARLGVVLGHQLGLGLHQGREPGF
jgi:hypothetical protein